MHSPVYVVCYEDEYKKNKKVKEHIKNLDWKIYERMYGWADYVQSYNENRYNKNECLRCLQMKFAGIDGMSKVSIGKDAIAIKHSDLKNYAARKISMLKKAIEKINVDNYRSESFHIKNIIQDKGYAWICVVDSEGCINSVECVDDWITELKYVFKTENEDEKLKIHMLGAYDYHW